MVATTALDQPPLPQPTIPFVRPDGLIDPAWHRWLFVFDKNMRLAFDDIDAIDIDKATAAQLRALTSDYFVGTAGITGAMEYVDAGNVSGNYTPDYTAFRNLKMTLTGNSTLKYPSASLTPVIGMSGMIEVVQDGTGGRTLGFDVPGTNGYVFPDGVAPTIDATLSRSTGIMYHIRSASRIWLCMPFRGVR